MEDLAGIRVRGMGAFELKRAYQSNLALGLLLAAGLHLAVIAAVRLAAVRQTAPSRVVDVIPDDLARVWVQPDVVFVPDKPGVIGGGGIRAHETGIPVPMDDELVLTDVALPTRDDLRRRVVGGTVGGDDRTSDDPLQWPVTDTFPKITDVAIGVRLPEPIRKVPPRYPVMAERAGLEGQVIVRALVDEMGRVRDAVVVRCSAPGVGFEESARDALLQWVFTPAVQNDHPVAVWVNIPVRFATR
jgi:TonB family protein